MKTMTQEDIDKGLEELFKGQKKPEEKTVAQQRENLPRAGAPKLSFEPEPEPEPEEEETYWTGEDWEKWAYSMYKNYPDSRNFLPEWFLKAIQDALNQ